MWVEDKNIYLKILRFCVNILIVIIYLMLYHNKSPVEKVHYVLQVSSEQHLQISVSLNDLP